MLEDLRIRLRSLLRPGIVERGLDDELRFHLERQIEKYTKDGMEAEQATRRAKVEFGGLDQVRQNCREARGVTFVETLVQDIRFALRGFVRNPGFTLVAVLTLALGVGANTAIFSVINAVMFRTLPVRQPEQLVQVGFGGKRNATSYVGESFSYPLFKDLRRENQSFSELTAFDSWDSFEVEPEDKSLNSPGTPIKGQLVSANFFSMLGLNAVIGRTFAENEESSDGGSPVAVISYAVWEHNFARDPHVIGTKLLVRGTPLVVIGVAPRHFSGVNPGKNFGVWIPLTMATQVLSSPHFSLTDVNTNWLSLVGRLKPDLAPGPASERLDGLFQQLQKERDISSWSSQEQRDFFTHHIVLLPAASGADYLRKEFDKPLWLLMGMVGLVLIIACANAANLLLARASTREREIAVRMALGASRRRLLRQLLTESISLATAAAILGLLFACWGSRILVALMSITLDVHPDSRVLAFNLTLALITGIIAGMAPAIGATRKRQSPALRTGFNTMESRTKSKLGRGLTVIQVALSLVVVLAAVLLIRTLRNLETLDPGFNQENVLLFKLDAGRAGYTEPRRVQVYQELVDRIDAIPGVQSASYSLLTPISSGGWDGRTYIEGYTPGPNESIDVYMNAVGPRFFETMGTPLLMGRSFAEQDQANSMPVAVINQTMAGRYFAGRNPIGRHIGRWRWDGQREYEVVGVAGDAKYMSLRDNVPPTAYLYLPQIPKRAGDVAFEVHGFLPPLGFVSQLREVVRNVDSRLIVEQVKTLAQQVDDSLDDEKLVGSVSACFGILALALACLGLYGVMAYSVARRTNEIGLRMALGAARIDVFRMIVGQGLSLAIAGLFLGVIAALMLARVLSSFSQFLYGIKATDPLTIIGVSIFLVSVCIIACYFPASRAMRIEPMVTLRYE
jgi:predicted permease